MIGIHTLPRLGEISIQASLYFPVVQYPQHTALMDWLAWEDPFAIWRDPEELKRERENNPKETQKWFSYAIRMVETMVQCALKQNDPGRK